MAQSELLVHAREATGKGAARAVRREGKIPGVVYGKGMDACAVSVDPKDLEKAISTEGGWNTLITLKGDGPFSDKVVILKDLVVDPIKGFPQHADFHALDVKRKIYTMVPVHTVGKSQGEKEGGSLEVVRHELEVYCLPSQIPGSIDVDVTALKIGDVVHIDDIKLPEGVEVPHEVNFTVVTCTGRKPEEEEGEQEPEQEVAVEE